MKWEKDEWIMFVGVACAFAFMIGFILGLMGGRSDMDCHFQFAIEHDAVRNMSICTHGKMR